jgi:hypothetical protein
MKTLLAQRLGLDKIIEWCNILIEVLKLPLILQLDELLRAVRRVRNVQLGVASASVLASKIKTERRDRLMTLRFEKSAGLSLSPSFWRCLLNGRRR